MIKKIIICLISILIAGCVGLRINPEERDRTGKFDGLWDAIVSIEKQQTMRFDGIYTCAKHKFRLTMYIADGQMSSLINTTKGDGYITEEGDFYVIERLGEWGTTDFAANLNLEMRIRLSGHLNSNWGEGDVVLGSGMMNYGCTGTVILKNDAKVRNRGLLNGGTITPLNTLFIHDSSLLRSH